ncbi:MAG: hypothetical protein AAGC60_22925 [Acidobacteriota bacterium]
MSDSPRDPFSVAATEHLREVDGGIEYGILEERFGIPRSTFEPYMLFRPNRRALWICRRDLLLPERPEPHAVGFPFFYINMRFPRPTTAAIVRFGHLATRNVVELEDAWVEPFLQRQALEITGATAAAWTGHGYLVARHRGLTLGLSIWRPAAAGADEEYAGMLQGLCPHSWTQRLGVEAPDIDGEGVPAG